MWEGRAEKQAEAREGMLEIIHEPRNVSLGQIHTHRGRKT